MEAYDRSSQDVCSELKTEPRSGLTSTHAEEILTQVGENRLKAKRKQTVVERFFSQFKDAMILILLAAAAISFYVALQGSDPTEFFEPALILLIVILNAIMGTVQESKAERSLEALQNMSAPHARVRRDGQESIIDASKLVPGDIVLIEAGDYIPADGRLISAFNLKVEESALTGESVPVEKDAQAVVASSAPLGDRLNMVYSGCSVTYGHGEAVVTATGMNTEMGHIAGILNNEKQTQTPLQKKLAQLGRMLGVLAIIICAVIFAIGLASGMELMEIFMVSISLAVSAIPEGLPAIVTIVLSIGVTRLAKRNAIIRKLPAVETLGGASVICSDKTGTLTQNRMTLIQGYCVQGDLKEDISSANTPEIQTLLKLGTLCCDGIVTIQDGKEVDIGDPTETCIVAAALKNGFCKDDLNKACPRVAEVPFDSDRKLMSVICRISGKLVVITKGGFDTLASRCTDGLTEKAANVVEEMSRQALRVLAVACKVIDEVPEEVTSETLEHDLTLIGLVGMIDPPREEAKQAVAVCRQAGIKPIMITGDHVLTASAIAQQLGIMEPGDRAVTGSELAKLSEEELDQQIEDIAVYARVSPEDKIRIVKGWQRRDAIVAMTGDGVNDAPALKAADIGCAMGITGTDVAKGASDMTLMDDNFATIVSAVREGRGIYDNIKKAVAFLLGTNIGEVLVTFIAMLLWNQAPFLSMQLLWINLVTDSLPAIALGMEAIDPNVMDRQPKPKKEGIFANGLGIQVVLQGVMFAILSLIGFSVGSQVTGAIEGGRTMAFLVLAFAQILHAYNMRSHKSLFKTGLFTNKYLNLASLVSTALMCLVLFVPPIASVFGLIRLPMKLYMLGFGLAVVPVVVLEIVKAFGLVKHHK